MPVRSSRGKCPFQKRVKLSPKEILGSLAGAIYPTSIQITSIQPMESCGLVKAPPLLEVFLAHAYLTDQNFRFISSISMRASKEE